MKGFYKVKEERLLRYLENVRKVAEHFQDWGIEQIPLEENVEADSLEKMADSLAEVEGREILNCTELVASIDENPIISLENSWLTPLREYILTSRFLDDLSQERKIKRQAFRFVV